MRRLFLLSSLLLVLGVSAVQGALPPHRPYAGVGVLEPRPRGGEGLLTLVLYGEPGVERLAEIDASSLPRLAGTPREPVVSVAARKGGWALIAYDEGGREGWVELSRYWDYEVWEEFLPGRELWVLPGMRKVLYALRSEPGGRGSERGTVSRDQRLTVVRSEGDWVLLEAPSGWFRWRDGDGRLTISLQPPQRRENR